MARTDSLTNWMTDIANSIREKTKKDDLILASEFDLEIANIENNDTTIEDELITRTITEYKNDRVSKIGWGKFINCKQLKTVDLALVNSLSSRAFEGNDSLKYLILRYPITVVNSVSSSMFDKSPIASGTGHIYVPDDLVERYKSATNWSKYSNQIRGLSDLSIHKIEIIGNNRINLLSNNNLTLSCTYNDGLNELYNKDEMGVSWSVQGNALIDSNGTITPTSTATAGDVITVTATSIYNNNITATKEIELVSIECMYDINLNNGEWVVTEEMINNSSVYKSDNGSYNINNGVSVATINVVGYTSFTFYIRCSSETNYDYVEAFAVDTEAERNKGINSTKGVSANTWIKCNYVLDGGEHSIQIMYSKDGSGNQGDDRGYFYIEGGE